MRFRVILNRFVGFLPRRGTTKEHILLYRTNVCGGRSAETTIYRESLFAKIQEYAK